MTAFENYAAEAQRIEAEIVRHGIVLGIDWNDELAVRTLAQQALACHPGAGPEAYLPDTAEKRARMALFGLAELMLKVMTESAGDNILTHGGPVWKAFARALWQESGLD